MDAYSNGLAEHIKKTHETTMSRSEAKYLKLEVRSTEARLSYLTRYVQRQRLSIKNLTERVDTLETLVKKLSKNKMSDTVFDFSVTPGSCSSNDISSPDNFGVVPSRPSNSKQPKRTISSTSSRQSSISKQPPNSNAASASKRKHRRRSCVVPATLRYKSRK